MLILVFLTIILSIVSVTLIIVFDYLSNKKGVYYSGIGIAVSIICFLCLFIFSFFNKKDLNSDKSMEIISTQQHYIYLNKQSPIIIDRYVKRKLNEFILDSGLEDSISKYSPRNSFTDNQIKKIEKKLLLLNEKYQELNPDDRESSLKKCPLKQVCLELIYIPKNAPIVIISRGISRDSNTYILKSYIDFKTNDLGIIEVKKCQKGYQGYRSGEVGDLENELLLFSDLKKCSIDLSSKCYFWKEIQWYFLYRTEEMFLLENMVTYLINGKVYPSYRLFNYDDLLNVCVKPTVKVLL